MDKPNSVVKFAVSDDDIAESTLQLVADVMDVALSKYNADKAAGDILEDDKFGITPYVHMEMARVLQAVFNAVGIEGCDAVRFPKTSAN